jgi:hypothetical protein
MPLSARWLAVVAVLAFLAVCAGCGESHGPMVAGIDGNMRVGSLTESQWTALCGWIEDLRGDEPLYYDCDGTTSIVSDACVGTESPPCYDWRANTCLRSPMGIRGGFVARVPECEPTVAEIAACWARNAGLVCGYSARTPECARAYCIELDAGVDDVDSGS